MALADYSTPHPGTPFPGNIQDHRCPACEALYRDTEELARKVEAAEKYAEAMKQIALAEEAKYNRLLRRIFSRQQEKT